VHANGRRSVPQLLALHGQHHDAHTLLGIGGYRVRGLLDLLRYARVTILWVCDRLYK